MIGRRRRAGWVALLVATAALAYGHRLHGAQRARNTLQSKLDGVVQLAAVDATPCAALAATKPLVLLVLGQSNAANHGEARLPAPARVPVFSAGRCAMATDPLPGGTGRGGSIWSALPQALAEAGTAAPSVVLSLLAVDSTMIVDWTDPDSPIYRRLVEHVADMSRNGLPPTLVLWQQGESDARLKTPGDRYAAQLGQLRQTLYLAGSSAPLLLALSTVCRSVADDDLRQAIAVLADRRNGFRLGADTDTLAGPDQRLDGCHLSSSGQVAAARLWADRILAALKG
ncbi:sialate O-acetylesterase [Ideonella sp. A 288]|uniref:sialate O-acetylesterase n=1 Tax=Ideonella sp. A 288 TaxID=1962181 RepID=UPI000B4C1F68|nr:sialate O-acetylesterase [Ideonella sp. A 288]